MRWDRSGHAVGFCSSGRQKQTNASNTAEKGLKAFVCDLVGPIGHAATPVI